MPFEYLAENLEVAYPFQDLLGEGLDSLFVEAQITFTADSLDQRVKLVRFDLTAKRIRLEFEDGTLIADVTHGAAGCVQTSYVIGEYTIYQWSKVSTLGTWFTGDELVARFTVLTSEATTTIYPLLPTNGFLISSLVNPRPTHVRKIAVRQPGEICCTTIDSLPAYAEGHIAFKAGANMNLEQFARTVPVTLGLEAPVTTRTPALIVFDVQAGAGEGAALDCPDEESAVRTIRGAKPDEFGNFNLTGKDCVWVERPLEAGGTSPVNPNTDYLGAAEPNTLKLNSNCLPCCDCGDYGDAYAAMATMWARAQAAASRVHLLLEDYKRLRQIWIDSAVCTQDPIKVEVRAFARPDYSLAISGMVVNRSGASSGPITLTFNIVPGSGNFLAGSGQLEIDSVVTHVDGLVIVIPTLANASQARYSFDMRWSAGAGLGLMVTANLSVATPFGAFVESDVVTLVRPLEKS